MKYLNTAMLGAVLWPAFLGAAVGVAILFSMIDPEHIEFFGRTVESPRQAAYTIGFFVFWFLIAGCSYLALWLYLTSSRRPPTQYEEGHDTPF